jgi:hypothetical protein
VAATLAAALSSLVKASISAAFIPSEIPAEVITSTSPSFVSVLLTIITLPGDLSVLPDAGAVRFPLCQVGDKMANVVSGARALVLVMDWVCKKIDEKFGKI